MATHLSEAFLRGQQAVVDIEDSHLNSNDPKYQVIRLCNA